jgi:hypothetical protein
MSFYLLVPFLFRFIKSRKRAIEATVFFLILGKAVSYIGNLLISPLYPESQKDLIDFFLGAFWLPAEMAVSGVVSFSTTYFETTEINFSTRIS